MGKKLSLKKADAAGIQGLVTQLQQQAGDGEIDANLIDQLAEAVNVAVDQAGDVHDEVEGAAAGTGAEVAPAQAPMPPAESKPEEGEEPEEVEKVFGSRPGVQFVTPGSAIEGMESKLPDFVKALEGGSLRKAQQIIEIGRNGQEAFDEMFQKACRAVLAEGGFSYRNIAKLHIGAPAEMDLQKAMTSSDLPGVSLKRLARLMMPVYAGLVRRFPATTPENGSDKASWRIRMGFQNVNFASLLSVAEGEIGQEITEPFTLFEVPYRDMSLNDKVSLKAIAAAKGYDDPLQVSVITLMSILLSGQERKVLGDNYAAIAKPTSVTGAASGTGAYGNATDKFIVSALTYRGYLAGSTGGTDAIGETDGTLSAAVDLSAAGGVKLDWPAVPGAVAYNVFYNPSSHATNKYYMGTVMVNHFESTAALPSTGNAPSATNKSANANGYEGVLSWAELSTVYGQTITNKIVPTDLKGAKLTKGTGGITEIDAKLAEIWTKWNIAPTALLMSANTAGAVTDLLMGLNQYRIEVSAERGHIAGGMFVGSYVNRFAPYADGTPRQMDIIPHPAMPDGTLVMLCETIPYQMSRETRGWVRETLIPYTYFPLAAAKVEYPYSLYMSEVMECFHPSPQTAILGVDL